MKIRAFSSSRSLRSMPGPRGLAPTSSATSASLNATFGSPVPLIPASSGNAQSSSSIITPLIAAEERSAGDAEQQAVADLAGGAGHGHTYGLLHGGLLESVDAGSIGGAG